MHGGPRSELPGHLQLRCGSDEDSQLVLLPWYQFSTGRRRLEMALELGDKTSVRAPPRSLSLAFVAWSWLPQVGLRAVGVG